MKKLNKVELSFGHISDRRQGIDYSRPAAIVNIETEDDALLERLIVALETIEI